MNEEKIIIKQIAFTKTLEGNDMKWILLSNGKVFYEDPEGGHWFERDLLGDLIEDLGRRAIEN